MEDPRYRDIENLDYLLGAIDDYNVYQFRAAAGTHLAQGWRQLVALTVQAYHVQLVGGVGATETEVADTMLRLATHVVVRSFF